VQFWDKNHLVADAMREHLSDNQPDCCDRSGHIWDAVALYPKEGRFSGTLPTFVGGPVVRAEPKMWPKLQDAYDSFRRIATKPVPHFNNLR